MTHTGLLGRVVVTALIAGGALGSPGELCNEYYQPLYEKEVSSLLRVHTNLNHNCVNLSQLILYQENEKIYWMARNTATFRQPLLGEHPVGEAWWCSERDTTKASLVNLVKGKGISKYWEGTTKTNIFQETPKHLFWVNGTTASTELPRDWSSGGIIRIIKQTVFIIPRESGSSLRVPIYEDLRKTKLKKQYMLNKILKLQSELEVISNQTALALNHINDQLNQTKTVIYQIKLIVAVIRNTLNAIRKLAYVRNQRTPTLDSSW